MSIRRQMFLTSAISLIVAIALIFLLDALSINNGTPLLIFVVVIGLAFLVSISAFSEAVRHRPSTQKAADSFIDAILRILFRY